MTDNKTLPWNEITQILEKSKFKKLLDKISESTFSFAARKENKSEVVNSALKMLQQTDPENATPERAEELAGIMQLFAKGFIKKK